MRVLILGGDGYLGWPTAMHLSLCGHNVGLLDNGAKRQWEEEAGVQPLLPIPPLAERVEAWRQVTGQSMVTYNVSLCDYVRLESAVADFAPDAIVHYGEQPSAAYSMMDAAHAASTQVNNVIGTLNLLWVMRRVAPACHLVKLGTMGEYGTPNIDIEEGFIEIEHKGRRDVLPFPKQPGSFYHLSKAHDAHNIMFACRVWKLAATNLNQGVVYGIETDETVLDERLRTSFHYDEIFGTVLNRFCVQAVAGIPLTIYGKGAQTRGFLNIRDTIQCVKLSLQNPAPRGEFWVFNQFTETFSVLELATLVARQARHLGLDVEVRHIDNPRVEAEEHYYHPVHEKLLRLGLQPNWLSDVLIDSMLKRIQEHAGQIRRSDILPRVRWNGGSTEPETASQKATTDSRG